MRAESVSAKRSRFRTADMAYIAIFAVLMAVCSWLSVPGPVEFTMQTFAVFCALDTLGGRRGTWAIVVFIALGAVGVPVFAGFTGGLGILLGATGGYIVGFLFMGLAYWLMTAKLGERFWVRLTALLAGLVVCYAFGTAWYMTVYMRETGSIGLLTALGWCVFPFIPFDLLKLGLALGISDRLRRLLRRGQ